MSDPHGYDGSCINEEAYLGGLRDRQRRSGDAGELTALEVLATKPLGTGRPDGPDSQSVVEAAGYDFRSFEYGFAVASALARSIARAALASAKGEG